MLEQIKIQTPFIKLEQLLKLVGTFPTGGACKEAIQQGDVVVNGTICLLRGKKLHIGDKVTYFHNTWEIIKP
ncbi:MAG TPA: RNA-binding S4 domain-containing protein [Ruminococcaceae bacterium]|nr:RNA-binding S4 domain-containing protein [Oscillospiraceae bacterium]